MTGSLRIIVGDMTPNRGEEQENVEKEKVEAELLMGSSTSSRKQVIELGETESTDVSRAASGFSRPLEGKIPHKPIKRKIADQCRSELILGLKGNKERSTN
jgi:hypothetical protein